MNLIESETLPVSAGDIEGLGVIYDSRGELIRREGEDIIAVADGWEMDVRSPWRRLLPKMLFEGFRGRVRSKLYLTTSRIVLIREVDTWREVSGEMTLLGTPNAVAKEARLNELKRVGARQFCVLLPRALRLGSSRKFVKRGSMVDLRLVGTDGRQYAATFWKSDGKDDQILFLIESQFRGKK